MIDKEQDRFVNFDPVTSRVDILMHETMAGKDMYSKLWNVVRMLLVLSDGQAAVERGFSINEKALRETQTLRAAYVRGIGSPSVYQILSG